MFHLIKKDILIQKNVIKLSFLLIIFLSFTFANFGPQGLTIGVLTITYMLIFRASGLEDKNNSDIILLSLPIKRTLIVFSKYLSVYLFALYAIAGFYLIDLLTNIFNLSFGIPFDLTISIWTMLIVTLYFSIMFPVVFKYGLIKSNMLNMIFFLLFSFGGTILLTSDKLIWFMDLITFLSSRSDMELIGILIVPVALILICSYFLSVTFYKNREF